MARKTFYLNRTTNQQTPAHSVAMEWYRNGDEVAIIDATTGEMVLYWCH